MGILCHVALSLTAFCLIMNIVPVSADDNLWDEFKSMDVFKIRDGNSACPLPVVGALCPESNAFYYFRCCGELNSNCCIRVQDWIIALIAIFIVLAIVSAIVNLLRCIFC